MSLIKHGHLAVFGEQGERLVRGGRGETLESLCLDHTHHGVANRRVVIDHEAACRRRRDSDFLE